MLSEKSSPIQCHWFLGKGRFLADFKLNFYSPENIWRIE